jgi:NADPH:quinone reductase-like Zn-dependent oxidoreductase
LGADEVIHHGTMPIAKEVRRLTNNRGVDVVVEHVGVATWENSVKSLATGGRLVTCGATTGYDAKLDLRFLFTRQLSIMGSYMGTKSELRAVLKLVAQGRLKPTVDKVFDLSDCMAAHNYLEQAKQFGKVVLRVE